jgi:hypothetical protein
LKGEHGEQGRPGTPGPKGIDGLNGEPGDRGELIISPFIKKYSQCSDYICWSLHVNKIIYPNRPKPIIVVEFLV